MTLSKEDIKAIDGLLVKRIRPLKKEFITVNKRLTKIDKKFDELFNFLDKKYLEVKRDVRDLQKHLHLPVSDF